MLKQTNRLAAIIAVIVRVKDASQLTMPLRCQLRVRVLSHGMITRRDELPLHPVFKMNDEILLQDVDGWM